VLCLCAAQKLTGLWALKANWDGCVRSGCEHKVKQAESKGGRPRAYDRAQGREVGYLSKAEGNEGFSKWLGRELFGLKQHQSKDRAVAKRKDSNKVRPRAIIASWP
jgi:hypothetical protein